jgi:hypothetical protein
MHPLELRRAALKMLASGWSVNATSVQLGVSRAAIRDWRDHGAQRRPLIEPLHLPAPEYAALFGYYLGDGCISLAARTTVLRVSCDRTYPAIIADVERCIRAVHPDRPVHRVKAPGVIVVQNGWKQWPCLFPQHGPGRKHERPIVLADWQEELVAEHPWDFLRGLFHSDGSRVANWTTRRVAGELKRYDYPRWMFVNSSDDILDLCSHSLDRVGVAWRRPRANCVAVSTRAGVGLLDEHIGLKC